MFINKCNCCKATESKPCGASTSSGGAGETINTHVTSDRAGIIYFSASAFFVMDRFIVEVGGQVVIDTGYISGSYTEKFIKPKGINEIKVSIYGNNNTAWNYTLCCPIIETCSRKSLTDIPSIRPSYESAWMSDYYNADAFDCEQYGCLDLESTLNRIMPHNPSRCPYPPNPDDPLLLIHNRYKYNCCEGCDNWYVGGPTDIAKCCKQIATIDNPNLCCQNECCRGPNMESRFMENGYCCPDTLPFCYQCVDDSFFDIYPINTLIPDDYRDFTNLIMSCNAYTNQSNAITDSVPRNEQEDTTKYNIAGLRPSTIYEVRAGLYRPEPDYTILLNGQYVSRGYLGRGFGSFSTTFILKLNNKEYNIETDINNFAGGKIYLCDAGDSLDIEFVGGNLLIYPDVVGLETITVPVDSFTGQATINIAQNQTMVINYRFGLSLRTISACGCGPVGDNPLP